MRLTLQARYSLIILVLIGSIVMLLSAISVLKFRASAEELRDVAASSLEQQLVHQLRERGGVISSFLADNLVDPLYRYDMQAMYELTQVAAALPDVNFVYVYDDAGRIVHDGTREIAVFGQMLDEKMSAAVSMTREPATQVTENSIEFTRPIGLSGEHLGGVHVGISLASIGEDIRSTEQGIDEIAARRLEENILAMFFITILLLMMGFALAMLVSRSLVRPIRALAEHAQRIGRGDYSRDIEIDRRDEIGDLASAFREMSRNLELTSEEVNFLAYHDSLTKLPNRVMLKRHLGQALARARRHETRLALLFIDLDDFKRVNDTLGHEAGDTLLKECAERLKLCVRREDFAGRVPDAEGQPVARLGGDEFTVIVEDLQNTRGATAVAERILEMVRRPFTINGHEVVVGASIGITVCPDDGTDVEGLLKNADVAMYHAKEHGKNYFQFYDASLNRMAVDRLSLESDLRRALSLEQLRVYYQPVLEVDTKRVVGVEALLRWEHPTRGLIGPNHFIAIAEQAGMIAEISEWVIRTACRDLSSWQRSGLPDLFVAWNLSSEQFRKQNVPEVLSRSLWESGLAASNVRLEITETGIMRNTIKAAEMLSEVQAMGVGVWIDDFGTGFSSLAYLRRFPIEGVKIDRSFVADIVDDEDDRRIISAIIAMAHSLNLVVTAEGVEDAGQCAFLLGEQCDLMQGNLYAPALPAAEARAFIARNMADPPAALDADQIARA